MWTPALGRRGNIKMKKLSFFIIGVFLLWMPAYSQYVESFDKLYEYNREDYPYVNDDNVRVRTLPSLQYSEIITKYNSGTRVNATTKIINEKNEVWYKIKLGKMEIGFIFGDYISFTNKFPESKLYNGDQGGYYLDAFTKEFEKASVVGAFESMPSFIKSMKKERVGSWLGETTNVYSINGFEVSFNNSNCWVQSECSTNFPNKFGIKMGDSLNKITALFNLEPHIDSNGKEYCGYGNSDISFEFEFDQNDKLINISYVRCDDIY